MAAKRRTVRITDERVLEVLAHPLRGRLLALLRVEGPGTASMLARRVGESSGVTSYHLRKLAGAGLVEEDVERGTRKERWWRSAHKLTSWSPADFLGNPAAHRASADLRRNYYRWLSRLLEQSLTQEAEWDKAWVKAANDSDDYLTLTPAQAKAMAKEIWEVVQRYQAEGDINAPGAARVIWWQHVVPIFGELTL